jgi:hypothetical protein
MEMPNYESPEDDEKKKKAAAIQNGFNKWSNTIRMLGGARPVLADAGKPTKPIATR